VTIAQDFPYALRRHWRRALLITLLAGALGHAAGLWRGARYTAEARLMMSSPAGDSDHGAAARNEAEILRDPAVMKSLAPELKPFAPPAPTRGIGPLLSARLRAVGLLGNPDFPTALARALSVNVAPDTDIVALRFTWPDAAFAARALNALLRDQQNLASGHEEKTQSFVLAQNRVADADAALKQIEAQIQALPAGGGVAADAGAIEREKDRTTSRIATARSAVDSLRVDRDLLNRKLEAAEKAYAGGGWVDNPDAPSNGQAMDPAFMELLDKRGKLFARQPPDPARLADLDRQIATARERAYQAARQLLAGRLNDLDTRIAAATQEMQTDETGLRLLDDRLVQIEALQNSRKMAESQEAAAERALDEARRAAETAMREAAGLRVLSEATLPGSADFPAPIFFSWMGLLAGMALGAASAMAAERTRVTIERPQDITRILGLPVLASIPELR
jgi:succinoglycan biosynthesis transport protein ExoP